MVAGPATACATVAAGAPRGIGSSSTPGATAAQTACGLASGGAAKCALGTKEALGVAVGVAVEATSTVRDGPLAPMAEW